MFLEDDVYQISIIVQKLNPPKMIWGKSPERQVVMPAGAFKFLKTDIRQKCFGAKAPNDGLSCPQGPLNFSKMTSGKQIRAKAPNDGLSCPQGPLDFSKMTSRGRLRKARARSRKVPRKVPRKARARDLAQHRATLRKAPAQRPSLGYDQKCSTRKYYIGISKYSISRPISYISTDKAS